MSIWIISFECPGASNIHFKNCFVSYKYIHRVPQGQSSYPYGMVLLHTQNITVDPDPTVDVYILTLA